MTWVRIDDCFMGHRKVRALSDRAFRLHMEGLCFAALNLSDGYLDHDAVRRLRGNARASGKHFRELVDGGLWHETDDGIEIHDYLDFNKSRDEVEAERRRKSEAGKLGASTRWGNASAMAPAIAEGNGSSDAPVPTRPLPVDEKASKAVLDGIGANGFVVPAGLLKDMPA